MELIAKILIVVFGASALKEPSPCKCQSSQSVIIEQSASVSIIDYSKNKCILSGDINVDIEPDGVSAIFIISIWSGDKLISKQTLIGKASTRIASNIIVRKQRVWVQIETNSPGGHLATVSFN